MTTKRDFDTMSGTSCDEDARCKKSKKNDVSVKHARFDQIVEMCLPYKELRAKQFSSLRPGVFNLGLYNESNELIGCCVYNKNESLSHHPMANIEGCDVLELGRLFVLPDVNGKNLMSRFVAETFKFVKQCSPLQDHLVFSLVDSEHNVGKLYKALSMKYHGIVTMGNKRLHLYTKAIARSKSQRKKVEENVQSVLPSAPYPPKDC